MKKLTSAVIIPARDSAWCLHECIATIAEQTKRPTTVLIGVDACQQTLQTAMSIQHDHHAQDKRKRGILDIEVYYFPARSWPYRVRNTLAAIAPVDVIHFFDADDLMYPHHLEMMSKALTPERFMGAYAEMKEGDKDPIEWDRAHGVVSICREVFLKHGGFEPWRCAADTEFHQRMARVGLLKCRPKVPTFLVRKHAQGLTMATDTGYQSDLRNGYKAEIKSREQLPKDHPHRLYSLGVAECYHCTPDVDTLALANITRDMAPPDAVIDAQIAMTAPVIDAAQQELTMTEQALAEAYAVIRHFMHVHKEGLNPLSRAVYARGVALVGRVK